MKYDLARRFEKYQSIVSTLRRYGYSADVQTGRDSTDCVLVGHERFSEWKVLVLRRARGWFIGMPRGRLEWLVIYSVRDDGSIGSLLDLARDAKVPVISQFTDTVADQFGLEEIPIRQWSESERQEEAERWRRFGWGELPDDVVALIGERYEPFFFPAGELSLPPPSFSWDLSELAPFGRGIRRGRDGNNHVRLVLVSEVRSTRRGSLRPRSLHPCYRLDVHAGIQSAYRDEWAMSLVSDGEDQKYLTPDFRFGLISSRDWRFHVFGEPLVDAFLGDLPACLREGRNG